MSDFSIVTLPTFSDGRGTLTVQDRALPFKVERTYWIYGADGQLRGGHRHRTTRQALIAVAGVVTIYMNDGRREDRIELSHPSQCLLVEPEDWHTMAFGPGSVLLVMASHKYDPDEYIDKPYD